MYKYHRGLKEWTLNKTVFKSEFEKKCKLFNINSFDVKFYSQQDEDKYIIQYLLKDKINDGTYLEIGGCDGILYSNTKTLEDFFGFKGILIEPQKHFFDNLKKNRSNKNNELHNCAVSNSNDLEIEFIGYDGEGGIIDHLNIDITKYNLNSYKVKNRKMKDILIESKYNYIDFMIIDVEGAELEVLKSIDFNFPIFCIIIEAHSNEQEKNKIFGDFLSKNGFTYKERLRGNEVWLNHNYFRKELFNL